MKTKLLLLAVYCILAYTGKAQSSKEERDAKQLRAKLKIKSITTFQADYQNLKGKAMLGQQFKVDKTTFDKTGELIEQVTYNKRGTVEGWIKYENDKFGNPEVLYNFNSNGSLHHRSFCENKYDSVGRLYLVILYNHDTLPTHKQKYLYDATGNLEQLETYRVIDSFDNEGQPITKDIFDSYEKYTYDQKGRTVKTEYYDNAHNYKGRVEFKYDVSGKMSEKVDHYVYVYKYLSNGLQIECCSFGGANGDQPVSVFKSVYEYYK